MKQEDKCGGKSGQKRWKIWREKWEQTTAARVTGNVADRIWQSTLTPDEDSSSNQTKKRNHFWLYTIQLNWTRMAQKT